MSCEWLYDPDNLTFTHYEGKACTYEIDIEQCRTSAELLDWIFQILGRFHPDPISTMHESDDHTESAMCMNKLLWLVWKWLDPQHNLCSGGREQGPRDWKKKPPRDSER